ncbi:MAG: ATP-grasp domain-containing protein [Methylotenera sp.]
MFKKLIIAANSARGYAQAAVDIGYEVVTLDAFADADTRRITQQSLKLNMTAQGVDAASFKQFFSQLNLAEFDGFLYGSLFDAAPDLLEWVSQRMPVVGNGAAAMRIAKGFAFFKCLESLKINHPEVLLEFPEDSENWLSKQLGGTGGTHIQVAKYAGKQADYYQRKIEGTPISLLFVADGNNAQPIGFNQQLIAPTVEMPYRFAGAVSSYVVPEAVQVAFERAVQQLTIHLGLKGLNSLDAIVNAEKVWILELNPRLSATFHLYPCLLSVHIQACAGQLVGLPKMIGASAQLIIYADGSVEIPADFLWPIGVTDIPSIMPEKGKVTIQPHEPICTVHASAETSQIAYELVLQKANQLRTQLGLRG